MEMTCVELDMRDALAKKFDDRIMTIGRSAVFKRACIKAARLPLLRRVSPGMHYRSYFSSISSTLPAAYKTGKLTLRPYSVVHSLTFDPKTRKVSGVRVIDAQSRNSMEIPKPGIFFVNASALESTRILLNSTSPEFPNGLANSSGELGHNLMDHHMGAGASGAMPGTKTRCRSAIVPKWNLYFRASAT